MSTGAIIAIVIGVLIVLALVMWLAKRGREAKLESRRHEAREIRRDAEVRTAEADEMSAEADERAARARREEAQARQQAARADEQRREADAHHERAHDLDPDTKGDFVPDRDRSTTGAAGTDRTAGTTSPDDAQYDRPEGTTDAEADRTVHEVHEERTTADPDRDPEVVREEENRREYR
jgi:FtsZ-interacting cell division protein ZipA